MVATASRLDGGGRSASFRRRRFGVSVDGRGSVLGRPSLFSREARLVRLEAGLAVHVGGFVLVLLAGLLRGGDELGVGRVGADRAAGLRQERQGALFRVELQQRGYEMKRRSLVTAQRERGRPGRAGGGGGEGVQSRGRRAIIRASGSRRPRLTFHSVPA